MFLTEAFNNQRYFFAVIITVVVSICVHELCHGIVAIWLGDRTPIETGHMTLNPAVHMGVFSMILLLTAGFAWGLMPINPSRLRGRYGEALVALAGPISNALLAALGLSALGIWMRVDLTPTDLQTDIVRNGQYLLSVFGIVNIGLCLFNLIPAPPLDGSRVLENFSPSFRQAIRAASESGGYLIALILIFSFGGRFIWPIASKIAIWYLSLIRGV